MYRESLAEIIGCYVKITFVMPIIYSALMSMLDFYIFGLIRCRSQTFSSLILLYSLFIVFLANLFYFYVSYFKPEIHYNELCSHFCLEKHWHTIFCSAP